MWKLKGSKKEADFQSWRPALIFIIQKKFYRTAIISDIYRLRWAIESLYKQLKQNFPLHFFYEDSVNVIQIQTWVVGIANLLITVLSRKTKRHCAFSQIVAMVRLTLMYYIDFISFMENPDKAWLEITGKENQKAPPEPTLFD